MIRELNYTGRLEIDKHSVAATIRQEQRAWTLDLLWNFDDLKLSDEFKLTVDVFVPGTTESRRQDLGRVGAGVRKESIDISEMNNPSDIRLRFKIVDTSQKFGIIRAQIDNLIPRSPENDENSKSLLPITKGKNLLTAWELEFVQGVPTLFISDQGDLYNALRSRVRAPWFYPVIMPQVFRMIFEWLASTQFHENEDKAKKWRELFINRYGCPDDFFDKVSNIEGESRDSDIKSQSRIVAENVATKMNDLTKIIALFEVGGD